MTWAKGALFAAAILGLLSSARADTIYGDSIIVTSVFDNEPAQTFTFYNITGTRSDAGIFSDWMAGYDGGTNITIIPGTPNGNETRNEFDINFSGQYMTFQATDTITLTFSLPWQQDWNTNFFALTEAIDVQVPSATVSANNFKFTMTNLDQTNADMGKGGKVQYIFDASPGGVPEPSTLLLASAGVLLLWGNRRFRRGRA